MRAGLARFARNRPALFGAAVLLGLLLLVVLSPLLYPAGGARGCDRRGVWPGGPGPRSAARARRRSPTAPAPPC